MNHRLHVNIRTVFHISVNMVQPREHRICCRIVVQQGEEFLLLEVKKIVVVVKLLTAVSYVTCSALQCEKQIPQISFYHSKH